MGTVAVSAHAIGCPEYVSEGSFKNAMAFVGAKVASTSRLASDPVGTFVLTLTNVVVGSVIQIETQAGAVLASRTAALTSEEFSLSSYAMGSALNDLRIKVRKGTAAPKYLPFSTLATGFPGAASVYVAQVADPIA